MKTLVLVSLMLATVNAHATNPPKPADPDATATASADASAGAVAGAVAGSYSHGGDGGSASAVGGAATATTGDSSAEGGDASADNSLELNQSYNERRQAPSVAQGSLMIGACGAGGNAGGSNSHGAAFLGLSWTPGDCKLLLAAAAYQAIGMNDSACEMVNGISAVKKRWKELGMTPPSCEIKPPVAAAPTPPVNVTVAVPDMSKFATKEEEAEREKRVIAVTGSK